MLKVGDKVPDFELPLAFADGKKDKVAFHSLLGKGPVVVAFYPIAFSGTCTTENCQLRDAQAHLDHLDAKVVGFSVDTPFANVAFAHANRMWHGLFSDANHEVVDKIWETMTVAGIQGRAKRGFMVVSPQGIVTAQWVTDTPSEWHGLDPIEKALAPFHTHKH